MNQMRSHIVFYLNGEKVQVAADHCFLSLSEWLREVAYKKGTKIVCAEGDCGACSVLRFDPLGAESFQVINSCVALLAQMDGSYLVTVEGIAEGETLHPVQQAMVEHHGSQCGFCTPGFVVALCGYFEKHEKGSEKKILNHLTGNLCRCTGYRPIMDAALAVSEQKPGCLYRRYLNQSILKELKELRQESVYLNHSSGRIFFAPHHQEDALRFLSDYPEAKIIAGGSDLMVQRNKHNRFPDQILSFQNISSFGKIDTFKNMVRVGPRVTLSELRKSIRDSYPELAKMLNIFASPQIKNVATLVGNVVNGSPIGDMIPFLLVAGGELELSCFDQTKKTVVSRRVALKDFYTGYRKNALLPSECVTALTFDALKPWEDMKLIKVSKRKDLDISTVSAAFWISCDPELFPGKKVIRDFRCALGGVGPVAMRFEAFEKKLIGKRIDQLNWQDLAEELSDLIQPISDHRSSKEYRRLLIKHISAEVGKGLCL